MRGIARSCAQEGVLTYLVCGGLIETEQTSAAIEKYGRDDWLRDAPLRRLGKPQEIADIVVFLASGKAAYATGATVDAVGASFLH